MYEGSKDQADGDEQAKKLGIVFNIRCIHLNIEFVRKEYMRSVSTSEYCMPSTTIYVQNAEYFKLSKEPNPSKLIQELLKRYYRELDKKIEEQKPPESESLKTENSNTKEEWETWHH